VRNLLKLKKPLLPRDVAKFGRPGENMMSLRLAGVFHAVLRSRREFRIIEKA
jgi:hypothetical protein